MFALYSRDGAHLSLQEFARLVVVEYDHGFGRDQLPQQSWGHSAVGLRRWAASFRAHIFDARTESLCQDGLGTNIGNILFFEFSVCLSRACLGKKIAFK